MMLKYEKETRKVLNTRKSLFHKVWMAYKYKYEGCADGMGGCYGSSAGSLRKLRGIMSQSTDKPSFYLLHIDGTTECSESHTTA